VTKSVEQSRAEQTWRHGENLQANGTKVLYRAAISQVLS